MSSASSQRPESKLVRCTEHSLAYDPALASGCALCRRSADPKESKRSAAPSLVFGLLLLAAAGAGYLVLGARSPASSTAARPSVADAAAGVSSAPGAGRTGPLATTNEAGRSGAYYLPAPSGARRVPVLVAIHGTGGRGSDMVATFRALADAHSFAIVAPDSRRSPDGQFTWQVGDAPGEVTGDFTHILACLAEVRQLAAGHVALDGGVLIAGYSGGASTAPYVGTNSDQFSAFAVLHGGVFPGGLGKRSIRGWFSTGQNDTMRPPAMVRAAAEGARGKGLDTVYREFPSGHEIGAAEAGALIEWWLKGRG